MSNCLFCYKPPTQNEQDFHASCSKKIFGQPTPPALPYSEEDLEPLAKKVIQSQTAVTGVQAKLSLHITGNNKEGTERRFTIVGLWGGYILKPPTALYPQLPEVEDVTMHLAQVAKIKTAPHSLIRLQSGNLAYVTKRIDRAKRVSWPWKICVNSPNGLPRTNTMAAMSRLVKPFRSILQLRVWMW